MGVDICLIIGDFVFVIEKVKGKECDLFIVIYIFDMLIDLYFIVFDNVFLVFIVLREWWFI